jgi:hypothetical protein|tara:strand:+ start:4089 stop:4442 length:354 start_codon:yes stop_codon:yes gene_type:complete
MLIVLKEFQNKLADKSDPNHTFYFRTKLHVFLVNYLFLNMLDENEINFVKIFDNVPRRIGARSTIFEVLQEGLDCGYFIKKNIEGDKRKRIYSLSPDYYDFIKTLWNVEDEKKVLSH